MTKPSLARELENPFSLRRWLRLNLALLALTGLLCLSMPVLNLDQRLGDLYFRMRESRPTSGRVALVVIDDATLARYGRWPWPRRQLARLLRVTSSVHPKAIGIDILLSDREDEANDSELASAIAATPNVVLATKISGSLAGSLWVDPIPIFAKNAAAIGHVQATMDADGVCRQIPIAEPSIEGRRYAFALKLAELARPDLADLENSTAALANDHGIAEGQRVVPEYLRINYAPQLTEGDKSPSFVALSAGDLLDGKSRALLEDKVVLIGFGGVEISDRLFTPVSGQIPMPGVEVNANVVDMLLSNQQIREPGWAIRLLLLVVLGVFMLWVVVRWPGPRGLIFLLSALLSTYGVGLFLFARFGVLLHYGPLLVAGVLAAPLSQLENLLTVDGAVTRRLRDLQLLLKPSRTDPPFLPSFTPRGDASVHLHWKLKTLRSLQERLGSLYTFDQTLLETMQEALAVFRADGALLFHNLSWQRFCEKQGMSTTIPLGAVTELMGGWPELHQSVWETGIWREKEAALKQGQWRIRAARLPETSHAEGGAIMLVVEDTTAGQERDRARGEALSFVTHELRTPLIAIQGFAEFLMRYPERSTGTEVTTIFREARRLVAMINAYLEVLRLDVGARPMRVKPVDIVAVAKHVEQIVQPLAQTARIRLQVESTTEVQLLECDENLVSGAILNLLSNAVKYSPAGSEVILRMVSDGETMEFAVHNSGPAIPAPEMQHLFEPFYRAGQTEGKPGWGLGLAFVKRIAEQHGGRVEVRSDSTTGTCFRMILPMKSAVQGEVLA